MQVPLLTTRSIVLDARHCSYLPWNAFKHSARPRAIKRFTGFHSPLQNLLLQREICERESERLSNLINSGSPLITTNYALSIAKASLIEYPSGSQSSGAKIFFVSKLTVFTILLLTIVHIGR